MLVRLTKDQIVDQWPLLKHAIRESLPPVAAGAEDRMSRILANLIFGVMQAWVSVNSSQQMTGIVVTTVTEDGASGIKNLLIYCMYAFRQMQRREFLEGLVTLKRYATGCGCTRIVGYTANKGIEQLVAHLGGEAEYRFITLPTGGSYADDKKATPTS